MRAAGNLSSHQDAKVLSDYLLTLGIETEVMAEENLWVLWVLDDHHLNRAKEILASFEANPQGSEFVAAAAKAEAIRVQEEKAKKQAAKNFVEVRKRWAFGTAGRQPVTWGLIAVSVLVALGTGLGSRSGGLLDWLAISSYQASGGYIRWSGLAQVGSGQVWRLVTPIFLHFGILHILFNMFWLRDLGGLLETRLGIWKFLLLVLVIAIPSNLTEYFWTGPAFGGMSGVVYGLFGYVWIKGKYDPRSGLALQSNTVTIMLIWLALGFTGLLGGIANGAHVGGLVMGCLIAYLPTFLQTYRRPQ